MECKRVTTGLQDALREVLADWESDLSSDWRPVIDGVELAFDAVDGALELHPWEPIFPSRRHVELPGEPDGAHMFRAFDNLPPQSVRCVVVGQDPYCLLYTSPSPRDGLLSRMPSSA